MAIKNYEKHHRRLINELLFLGGNPESAAQLLEKAAKLLEAKFPDEALALYTKAADTVGNEDRPKEASEYLAKVAKLQVRTGSFKQSSPW